ncbi:hypothetical protein ZIOFF_009502 [Zingiber officinale]|uniref:TRF2/HOY1 PH-like domain-containing protein n=1 Tax=Zingiber officinale TaxID=94328 RepID=A0A8J5LRI5_ZINOF|nr:hypothetical protein ZIOFF_009502 [Zingiber officinale]
MVWSSDSGKRRADSTQHSTPPPPAVKLEVEEPLDEKRVRLHKRIRDASTSCEQALYNNALGEPGPLFYGPGRLLMNNPSSRGAIPFAAYSSKIQWAEWFGLQISASTELIPPSTRLRLLGGEIRATNSIFGGTQPNRNDLLPPPWPYMRATIGLFSGERPVVSLAACDQIAATCYRLLGHNCYHHLRLTQSKSEVFTSTFDNVQQPKDVNILRQVLGSRSRYVKGLGHSWLLILASTNMLFNSTSSTTSPASIIDYVTLLSKNFEKLIDCDPQLKLLSQQPDIILESPYFNPQYSVLENQSDSKSHINDFIKDDSRTTFFGFYEPGPPCATSSISNKTETRDSFGRTLDFDSQETTSPSSVEELASGNTSLSCDSLFDKEITDFIPQFFDNDSQSSAAFDEQSIISRGNSLCCLLQQNTVGGMVLSLDSGKRQADSTQHSTPPPPAVKLEVEEPLDEKRVRLHKRIRDASTSCEQALYNNVLGELGPLGLRPRKSQSLADMSQMMLSQANAGKTLCFTSMKGTEVGEQSDCSASPSSLSKIKASNFPTSLLRIGKRKCVSRYEGDLVAKCYFAKHKLVWEVLEGGLKYKIEFHCSLLQLRKYFLKLFLMNNPSSRGAIPFAAYSSKIQWAECTLTIADFFFPVHLARRDKLDNVRQPKDVNIMTQVLGSRSRYVKGLSPLPKLSVVGGSRATNISSKHHDDYGKFATMKKTIDEQNLTIPSTNMLFNSTSSATSPASIIDYVTLLSKNFEKLIDCDPQLKLLSQQPDIILESPYFNPQYSVLEDQSDSKSHINDFIKDDSRTTFSGFYEPGPPCATSSISNKKETRDSFGRTLDFDSQETTSPSSVEELASGNTTLGNSLCCLLQQNTVGGMVWSSDSGKRRADSTQHSTPPPPAVKLEVKEPLDERRVGLNKRIRDASTSCEQVLYNNVLGELGTLGLRPRKSRSLADMSQMMLSQANAGKTLCFTSLKGSEVGEQSDFSASPSSLSKIKASNFPTSLLRIGTRKCVSRYEGAHGTLDIVLARPPLFFRATDPQPRKHTPTLTIADFFSPVHLVRRDKLDNVRQPKDVNIMTQTLLSKNFEKLIDCDPQLKLLSQQPDIILESPYFNPQYSVLEDQSDSKSHINDFIKDDSRTTFSGFYEPGPPCATSSISNKTETRDSFGRTLDFDSHETTSPSSVEELASGNTTLSCDALFDKEITDFIPQLFDNDSQSSAASDEQSIISRGNSLCCLLQQNTVGGMVWSSDSSKRRADSTQHSTPPPLAVKLEVKEPLDERRVRLHKRIRDASTSCEQALYNNVLGELGTLGLRPRKSRSLADMSQMMLSQANAGKTLCFTSLKGSEVGEQSDFSASPSSLRKIKASNFPTSLLRIGTRKCVSRYEGNLVAKCYFAKHKLVWEVLEGGLKCKIEFHCSLSQLRKYFLKALYNNVLGEPGPLGLRPRKSRSLADMSQMMFSQTKADDSRTTFSDFYEPGPPCATSSISKKTETRDSFGRTLDFDSQETTSPRSVEELASGNTSLSCDALFDKEITDFIPQFFDNDSQSSAASDEQSINSRGNSLCCLVQQNTVGGMVWSSDSGKRRADSSQHSTPPPPAVKLEVENPRTRGAYVSTRGSGMRALRVSRLCTTMCLGNLERWVFAPGRVGL